MKYAKNTASGGHPNHIHSTSLQAVCHIVSLEHECQPGQGSCFLNINTIITELKYDFVMLYDFKSPVSV